MTNDFQVEIFSFNHQKQWKLSVCKKVINQLTVNELYLVYLIILFQGIIHDIYHVLKDEMKWNFTEGYVISIFLCT